MPDYSNETELKNEDQFEELEIEKVKSEIEGDSTANLTIREADGENDFVTIQIDESKAKTRLDKLICQELDLSRARVEALIDDGMVCLNGQVAVKASKKFRSVMFLKLNFQNPKVRMFFLKRWILISFMKIQTSSSLINKEVWWFIQPLDIIREP